MIGRLNPRNGKYQKGIRSSQPTGIPSVRRIRATQRLPSARRDPSFTIHSTGSSLGPTGFNPKKNSLSPSRSTLLIAPASSLITNVAWPLATLTHLALWAFLFVLLLKSFHSGRVMSSCNVPDIAPRTCLTVTWPGTAIFIARSSQRSCMLERGGSVAG